MKQFNYFILAFSTLGALAIFALLIVWGVSLPKTAYLWIHGAVWGWFNLLFFSFIFAAFVWMPALMIIDEIKIEKENKRRNIKRY